MLEKTSLAAKIGNGLISAAASTGFFLIILVGGYVIWYTVSVYQSSFLDEDLLTYKPSLEQEDNQSLRELMKVNPDVCGWITIDGTNIDYPIVQGEDNFEYLNMDVFGEFSLSGTVYLDTANNRNFTDPYNILYGHHMDNGRMFGQVVDFMEEDFFNEHKTGILFLPDKTYAISFFASLETNAYEAQLLSASKTVSDMPRLLSYASEHALAKRTLTPELSSSDNIVCLVTCENSNTDGRAVLLGRLDEIDYVEQGIPVDTPQTDEWIP